ncbi:MAG: FtsK/SpoIIIE domain-containing protein [Mycobacteriales bacterium]
MNASVVVLEVGGVAHLGWGGSRLVHPGPRLPAGSLAGVLVRWSHAGMALGVAVLALTVLVRALVAFAEHRRGQRRPQPHGTSPARWTRRRAASRVLATLATLAPASWRGQAPVLLASLPTPVGLTLRVALPAGASPAELPALADRLAVAADLAGVRITRDPGRAAVVELALLDRDPFSAKAPAWPWADQAQAEPAAALPLGVDETGAPVTVELLGHHLLIGGEPGAGKSTALATLLAGAALDPSCALHLLDGKGVDLPRWRPLATGYAGASPAAATGVLAAVVAEMDRRFAILAERGDCAVVPGDGLGSQLVVCDELAHYLTAGEKAERVAFAEALRDLVARGRAAGVIVAAATQKPGSDLVPTSIRDLVGYRLALRCTTPAASDTILGAGWAAAGISAATIPAARRGVGYLLADGPAPVRLRCYRLGEDLLGAVVARGVALRQERAEVAR